MEILTKVIKPDNNDKYKYILKAIQYKLHFKKMTYKNVNSNDVGKFTKEIKRVLS
jgi:hypothetical protein